MTVLTWVWTTILATQHLPSGDRVFVGPFPRVIPGKQIEVTLSIRLTSIACLGVFAGGRVVGLDWVKSSNMAAMARSFGGDTVLLSFCVESYDNLLFSGYLNIFLFEIPLFRLRDVNLRS